MTNYSPGTWLTTYITLLTDLTLERISKYRVKVDDGYVQKWHLRYKTSDISERKQSTAKLTTECL